MHFVRWCLQSISKGDGFSDDLGSASVAGSHADGGVRLLHAASGMWTAGQTWPRSLPRARTGPLPGAASQMTSAASPALGAPAAQRLAGFQLRAKKASYPINAYIHTGCLEGLSNCVISSNLDMLNASRLMGPALPVASSLMAEHQSTDVPVMSGRAMQRAFLLCSRALGFQGVDAHSLKARGPDSEAVHASASKWAWHVVKACTFFMQVPGMLRAASKPRAGRLSLKGCRAGRAMRAPAR